MPGVDQLETPEETLSQLQQLFTLELSASTSLNARGTTLAGLVGATIALVANFANAWALRTGTERMWLDAWFGVSLLSLALAAAFSLIAIWPASKWRQDFLNLQNAVIAGNSANERVQHYVRMTDKQRRTNEDKAMSMRAAYSSLGIAIVAIGSQAAIFAL